MFRPIPAIITFPSERVLVLYQIYPDVTMVRSYHHWLWLLLLLRDVIAGGRGGSIMGVLCWLHPKPAQHPHYIPPPPTPKPRLLTFRHLTTPIVVGRTANLQSCILYIYSTNIGTEYFKHGIHSPFFCLQNAVCFIILTYLVPVLFTFCIFIQQI